MATPNLKNMEKTKSTRETEERNKELLSHYYQELDKTFVLDNFIEKFISSDFILHLPGGLDIKGKKGLHDYYVESKKAFANGTHTIDEVIAERDKVAFRATSEATHQGEFMGIQPTGKKLGAFHSSARTRGLQIDSTAVIIQQALLFC